MELNSKEIKEPGFKNDSARVEINPDFFSMRKSPRETGKAAGETLNRDVPLPQGPIDYLGDKDAIDPADIKKAGEMITRSLDFIVKNAETPVERKVAETLESLFQSNKVVLCDSKELCGNDAYGVFCSGKDPYIAIDLNCALDYGTAELVDTLSHEGYHAAQYKAGHKNDIVKEEVHAWNFGLIMSNEYRIQHGQTIARINPYTEHELRNQKGYTNSGGGKGFAEIC